jgi:threonine dehydrogenase-like Zn-dependent dehydrogenase
MRALTILPGVADSARVDDVPEPSPSDGAVLVRALALGVCGTDREIVAGEYGSAPPGQERLILGHESFGQVEEAPKNCGLAPGDLVVGIVRHPDPVPCSSCAAGEWDMCRNGRYTEHGIKERNGFGAEYFRLEPNFAIKLDPGLGLHGVLMEPASIVAKAWDQVERIGRRSSSWQGRTAVITGGGPIGQLAALLGKQRGYEVHIVDRNKEGPKPVISRALGAHYHNALADLGDMKPDVLIECTGAVAVVRDVLERAAPDGIICLTGVTAPGHPAELDLGLLNRLWVLNNQVVFGSVNANRAHWNMAAAALAKADPGWLDRLITRREPLDHWADALKYRSQDIKVIIDFAL